MGKFVKGTPKPKNSGIRKGQKQTRTLIKQQVYDLVATAGKHPVTELMNLLPELAPKERARVWLELLQYMSPKLSAQAVTIDDNRDDGGDEPIDVTPVSNEELIKKATEGE